MDLAYESLSQPCDTRLVAEILMSKGRNIKRPKAARPVTRSPSLRPNRQDVKLKTPRPKAARPASRSPPTPLSPFPTPLPPNPEEYIKLKKPRPKHGEHKWMRQLATTETPEDLLQDLLDPRTAESSPYLSFPSSSQIPSRTPTRSSLRRVKTVPPPTHIGSDTQLPSITVTRPSITVTRPEKHQQSLIYSPELNAHSHSLSLSTLADAEKRLPKLSRVTKSNNTASQFTSSIPKLPRIVSADSHALPSLASHHQRSRSYSDPALLNIHVQ